MALRLCAAHCYGNMVKFVRLNTVLSYQRNLSSKLRSVADATELSDENKVVITEDGSTIVCWHPEKAFPHECSKAIPQIADNKIDTVLNIQNVSKAIVSRQSEEAVRAEIMKITHTTKHRWFPRSKDKYYRKFERDREYL